MTHQPSQDQDLRTAARVLLDACYEDCGRPDPADDENRDDGPVGASATRPMALTFAMMRNLETALTPAQAPDKAGEREGTAEEIKAAFDEAAKARDEAGYVGTPASCIQFFAAEADRLERRLAALTPSAPIAAPVRDDGALTLAALHAANAARQTEWCQGGDAEPDLAFRGNELAGETGEACNVIKKLERERHGWRGSRATLNDLAEELADVIICADLCAVTAGIDLGAAVVAKFNATSDKVGISVRLPAPAGDVPTPVRLREGAFYRKGDGTKVGPMFLMRGVWYAKGHKGDWSDDGVNLHGLPRKHPKAIEWDLIAEWHDAPAGDVPGEPQTQEGGR